MVEELVRDFRYALRTLARQRGFALVAILSLALGIGANAAIFSVVNAVMLRRLPVKEPGRLVQVARLLEGRPGALSYPLFEHFRGNMQSISSAFVQSAADQAIALEGEDEFVAIDLVDGAYFGVLGIDAAAGRILTPTDDVASPESPAAVITDQYWRRRFGRSTAAVGTRFTLRDRTFTIVGVTPASFRGARQGRVPDVIVPLLMIATDTQRRYSSDFNWLNMLVRLKPGATVDQANAEVQVLFARFVDAQIARTPQKERAALLRQRAVGVAAPDGFSPIRDSIGQPLLLVMGIVGLILLLACLNLSGMLLARAAARQREISIRLAIGAGRGRLVRQFLAESLVLALLGGLVGLTFAGSFSEKLFALFINGRDVVLSVTPDWRVLAFTGLVSLVACCAAGLVPAFKAGRADVNPALKSARIEGHGRMGRALVVAQLSISMVLLVAATLFVGTLAKLYAIDRGFNSDGVLVVSVRTARPYPAARAPSVQRAIVDRLSGIPGVHSASAAQMLPVAGGLWDRRVQVEGHTFGPDEPESVGFNVIGPKYFATLGTPVVAGREFDERDTAASSKAAIVNESFARFFFQDRTALGGKITSVGVTYEIVGIVRDAKYQNLRDEVIRTMYIPWTQREGEQPTSYSYLVRVAGGDPMRLAPGLDRVIREADPALRVRAARPYAMIVDQSIGTERIMATLGGFFGLLALLVAGLGVFGLLAFQVARRTNELGVRMALGAGRIALMKLVMRDVVLMIAGGVAIGAGAALLLTGLVRKLLFGLTPTEPAVFVVAAGVLAAAALVAGWLPALRAARVDPLVALRQE